VGADIFASVVLMNGLTISFQDQTNRYFGDFHRVCIQVRIMLPKDYELPAGISREKAYLEKKLEKMGVASGRVEAQQALLIESFLTTSQEYLERDDFPQQLLAKIQRHKPKPVFLRN